MSRRLALHIGLDAIVESDGVRRGLRLGTLNGSVDAARFAHRTTSAGFDGVVRLIDAEANVARVKAELAKAASLEAGDLFVVTYAGHGLQVPDQSGDEDEGADETWELWDASLTDDEIGRLLADVPEGVSVAFLSDSCHSGSGFKLRAPDLHSEVPDAPGMVPKRLGKAFRSRFLALSACPDEGVAVDLDGGLLTTAVVTTWDQHPEATWGELIDQACARVRNNTFEQEPRLSATDAGVALLGAPAFSAGAG